MLAHFGIDPVDLSRLGAALRGDLNTDAPVNADFQHTLVLKAMNLDPRSLTTAFRGPRAKTHPAPFRSPRFATSSNPPPNRPSRVHPDRPALDADPMHAAQIIADAVGRRAVAHALAQDHLEPTS